MALAHRLGKIFENVAYTAMEVGKVGGKATGKIAKAGFKGATHIGNKVMDGVEAAAKVDKRAMVRKMNRNVKEFGANTVDNALTNDASYMRIGKAGGISNKLNLLDEVATHTRAAGNAAYNIGAGFKIPFTNGKRTPALFKASDDSLIGLRATGFGKTAMIGGAMIAGTPRGVQTAFEDRRGFADQQSVGHSPGYAPAYTQNAGATGDLVFALNDLRRG